MSLPSQLIGRLARKQATTTVSISRPTNSQDAGGSVIRTYATAYSGVAAVVNIRSGSEAVRYGRENNRRFGLVLFAVSVDVLSSDRIVYGSTSFDVLAVRVPGSRSATDLLGYKVAEIQETS